MKTDVKPHLYRHDTSLPADWKGRRWCLCGRLETHPVHDLPEQPDDVTAQERRRVGDKED